MSELVIIGAGGFGREVFAIVSALRATGVDWTVEGFVDDNPSVEDRARVADLGSRVLGPVQDLASRQRPFAAVIAVGSPVARASICSVLENGPVAFPALVHPDATVGAAVRLASGVVVAPGARLSTNISFGRHVHVDQNVTVGHDATLGDFSRLNPQACVSGSVRVGVGAILGANATILQGLIVADRALVGAGSVVTRDVAPGTTVKGVPAR